MTDQKPTEQDTAKADRWVKQHATGWNGYVVDSLAVLLATIRAEAWKQGAKEAAELCTPKLDHWDKEIAEAEARGVREEREAVVRWLKSKSISANVLSALVERGDHREGR